jgi:putative ABC transport system permease protein
MISSRPPRRPSADARLDLELRDHIERQVADYVAGGMAEADARRRVRLELGGLDQAKEECRDVRPRQWLDELVRDIRIGWRTFTRERLFAVSVSVILTLGIGTSVAMFSVLHAIVLRPLPYARPGELTMLTTHLMVQNRPDGSSMPNVLDWRQQSRTFAGMTFYRRTIVSSVTFAGTDAPQRAQEGLVGPEFFELLGTPPLLGRTFSGAEFERRERVVVLSEGLWQEQFARSAGVLGRTLTIDGTAHTVIGVMPEAFQLPTRDTRFWRPVSILPNWDGARSARAGDGFEVIGRLAPNARLEDARTEMTVIAARLRAAYPSNQSLDIRVLPLFEHVVGSRTRQGVWLGFGAVLSLLAIACANVGGLLTLRAARRRRELAVRSALGASRARLVRQLLAENISLWALASVGGLLLAYVLISLLAAYGPAFPRMDQIRLDGVAIAVAFIGGFVVVTLCGTIPSLVAAKTDSAAAFSARNQSNLPRTRLQDALVTGQIAGALVLLIGAMLFAQSFVRAHKEDPGYPAEHLLVVRLDLPRAPYPDAAALAAFFHEARDRITRLPGVVAMGAMTDFFIRRNADQRVTVEGRDPEPQESLPRLAIESVTPGYFRAVGIEVVDGREFDERDLQPEAARVFIVNETLARRMWPGESAIGKRIVAGSSPRADGRWDTVVGVVKDMRREGLDLAPISSAFVPSYLRGMDMTIRASTDAGNLISAVRREIRGIDESLPVPQTTTANARLGERLAGRRFETQVLGLFAAIALVLSAAGLYASLAYQVALRTREIGIRSALGADRQSIVGMILGQGVRRALVGAALGVAGAVSAARLLQSLLYQTAALDAPSYAAAAAFVLLVAAVAAWVPAARAARISPTIALHEE